MYKHISYTNTCHTCTHMYMYAYTHLYTYIYYMYRYVCWCVKIWKIYRYRCRCRCRCRCRWRRRCVCEYKHRYFFQGPSGQWETVHSIWEEIPKLHRTWRLRNENTDVSLIKARSWRCFYWYMVGWLVWNLTPQVPFFLRNLQLRSSCHSMMEFVASVGWLCGNAHFFLWTMKDVDHYWSLYVVNDAIFAINSDIWYHLDFKHFIGECPWDPK